MKNLLLFVHIFLLNLGGSFAQENSMVPPVLQFQHLIDGLNNERITAISQDSLGFIWIGTFNGLHRYDGINFKIYLSNEDTTSLSSSRIERIFSDSKGNLWIGTADGICKYNRAYDNFTRFNINSELVDDSNLTPNRISGIVEDESGKIWMSSEKEGLFYYDYEQEVFISYYNKKTGLKISNILITELILGESDDLWIGLTDGLNKLDLKSGKVTHFPFRDESEHNIAFKNVRGLAIDKEGCVWIGTENNGLYRLKKENQSDQIFELYIHEPNNDYSLGNNSIYCIFVDLENQVWIGNENGGLHLFNRSTNSFFRYLPDPKKPLSISNNSIWSIFKDKEERLWIGTALQGVNIVDKNFTKFTHYYSSPLNPHSLNNSLVRGFWEDDQDHIWIATDGGGLNYWNRKEDKITHYTHDPEIPFSIGSNALLDFTEDPEGRLWIATWAGGIEVLTDEENMHFKKIQDLKETDSLAASITSSFALLTDNKGNIWSGNFQRGLGFHSDENSVTQIFENNPKDKNSLSTNTIYSVFEDSEGVIWAGGEDNGLNRMSQSETEEASFKRYHHDPNDSTSISGDIVNQIYEDSNNNIWAATSGGLSKYVRKTDNFVSFTSEDGLPTDFVVSILEDENGFLWIGTEKGLSKFDPEKKTFRNYSKNDGLQGDKFSRHASISLSTGEFMFGGTNGFNIFDPLEVKDNPYKPEVYLTDLKLFNKSLTIGENDSILKVDILLTKEIILRYDQNVITFEFVALNYTHADKNQYAYMLEGLEQDYNYVGNKQVATYTNLDPGEYTFKVKASNNDGVWNENGTQINITVLPPWYKTWWFYTLALAFIGLSIFSFIRWREAALKKDKALLAEAIEAKTQELDRKKAEIIARDEADKINNWTALGLNEFTEIVNKNKEDIYTLSQRILSHLIKFIHANQGTVTILNDDEADDKYLELVAVYANEEGKKTKTRIEIGQGLLGVCFSSGEVQYIDNLPEDYSKLTSGLGEARMNYLILVPLRLDEIIIGVIELSSFNAFQQHEIHFLQKLGEIITSSLYTLKFSRRTSILLEQSRAQSEELKAQEEEIRQNMEEMEATQEDFYRKEQELLNKLKVAEETLQTVKKNIKKEKK